MSKEIKLKDGRLAVLVSEPKGRHAAKASTITDNKQEYIPAAIAAQVIEIDGVGLVFEEVLDLPMSDYFAVVTLAMGTEGNDLLAPTK